MEKLKEQIKNYQLNKGNTYIEYEQDQYTEYQNNRYKRALYGLKGIKEEDVAQMCERKKRRINNVHYRAQKVINLKKQQIIIDYTNQFFQKLFPNSNLTKELLENSKTCPKFKMKWVTREWDKENERRTGKTVSKSITFKDLNLTKDRIIRIFMDEGILPSHFLSLKEAPVNIPSLKNESKIKRM